MARESLSEKFVWFFILFAVTGLSVASARKQTGVLQTATRCQVSGDLGKNFAPATVYVSKQDSDKWICTDSAKIIGGKFNLMTDFDALPSVRKITVGNGPTALSAPLFMDADDISISLGKTAGLLNVAGSESNEEYTKLKEDIFGMQQRMSVLGPERYDMSHAEQDRTTAEIAYDSLYDNIVLIKERYMNSSLDQLLGVYLLSDICSDIQFTRSERALAKVPTSFSGTKYYKDVQTYLVYDRKCIVGDDYPDFTENTPSGHPINLRNMVSNGTFTILVFWASWSEECKHEMPTLVKIYNEYKFGNIDMIGVSLDTDKNTWTKAIKDWHMDWKQVSDLKGRDNEAAKLYGVTKLPLVLILTQHSRIIYKGLTGYKLYSTVKQWGEK